MTRFSERIGLRSARSVVQVDSIDEALRNSLWNVICETYFSARMLRTPPIGPPYPDGFLRDLLKAIWRDFFKVPTDTRGDWQETYAHLRRWFMNAEWHELYDFLEFLPNASEARSRIDENFTKLCNGVLERELSAWRFSERTLVRISSEVELAAIDEARQLGGPLRTISDHLDAALRMLSDRRSPDYRNSIKESISAVEGMCSLMTGKQKADLGSALSELEKNGRLHTALKKAFGNLYGYTSDADGIRHALMAENNLTFEDAKFMLVACSAFVNYLQGADAKGGQAS